MSMQDNLSSSYLHLLHTLAILSTFSYNFRYICIVRDQQHYVYGYSIFETLASFVLAR